jgi:hypothetical protein
MANIPLSYYHASAAIPIANHGDFFNTTGDYTQNPSMSEIAMLQQLLRDRP